MIEEEFETTLKCIIVGNGQVGKTSMLQRYCKGVFTGEYKKTLGVDFLEKRTYVKSLGEEIVFHIWDTAGQEYYDTITKRYYTGAAICVIVFSTIDRDSFDNLANWKGKVEKEIGPLPMVIVQNKIDLMHEAKMTDKEVREASDALKVPLFKTCVKDNLNVSEIFEYLAIKVKGGDTKGFAEDKIGTGKMESEPKKQIVEVKSKKGKEKKNNGGCGIF